MRPLVVGAAGFVGRSVVRALADEGHEVRGLVQDPVRAPLVEDAGGSPVVGDILNRSSLVRALDGCDLAIHLAQRPSSNIDEMRVVRVDGCRTLLSAMSEARVNRVVIGSGYWVYADNPGTITEPSPLAPRTISRVNFDTEEVAWAAAREGGLEVVVVRPGMVYGPGSWFAEMVSEIRAGSYRYIGDGSNYLSPIHWIDAGRAFESVIDRWSPGATYLAVDDYPVSHREFAEYVSRALRAPSPRGIPMEEAEREWGTDLAALNAASRRASNGAMRRTGWAPKYPTFREGLPSVLDRLEGRPSDGRG